MRIIAGDARGRHLASPKSLKIRPTTDRVRESLFAILGELHDVHILDGFAGSGALGCEALSRGAAHVTFIDRARDAIALIEENLQRIDATSRATVLRRSFFDALPLIENPPDLIFLDPPYSLDIPQQALLALANSHATRTDALIVIEQHARDPLPDIPDAFELDDQRVLSETRLLFLYAL